MFAINGKSAGRKFIFFLKKTLVVPANENAVMIAKKPQIPTPHFFFSFSMIFILVDNLINFGFGLLPAMYQPSCHLCR